uniref:Uncharacterized protein n=1 Tax=Anguilla anguilla TaxID=7936 RepID=A0A0E9SIX6_ANGAN
MCYFVPAVSAYLSSYSAWPNIRAGIGANVYMYDLDQLYNYGSVKIANLRFLYK